MAAGPNGLCFSPDERFLYIAESGKQFATDPMRHRRRFEVRDTCRLTDRGHHGVQPHLRRPQPLAPVHLRLAHADGHIYQRARRAGAMIAQRLACISVTVSDIMTAEAFYTMALNFVRVSPPAAADPAIVSLLGATTITRLTMRRGRQLLELMQFDPPGAPYPRDSHSNDLWFQHCALVTDDMASAYSQLQTQHFTAISRHGPQTLPGGVIAYKFRDPEHHPLELIQFPQANPATALGIDHSAIAVADADRSIAFYQAALGLMPTARQVNTGPAQDALDDLDGITADVVSLSPVAPSPHLELLAYRAPAGRGAPPARASDIAATRLVFTVMSGGARLSYDPDGHSVLTVAEKDGLAF